MEPSVAFGQVLRTARKSANLTQEGLAHKAGIERNYVSLIERGINQPTIKMLFKLAGALGLQASALIAMTEQALESAVASE